MITGAQLVSYKQSFTHRDLYNARLDANVVVRDLVSNGLEEWKR